MQCGSEVVEKNEAGKIEASGLFARFHGQLVPFVLGERHVVGIVSQEVFRAQFGHNLGKGFVQLGVGLREKGTAAGAFGDVGEEGLAAAVASRIADDG